MTEFSVFAPSAAALWATIESYGLDPSAFFRKENVVLELPIDKELRIPYRSIDAIRARAARHISDEAFGLRAGRFIHPSHLGALGYAWLASRTMRIALDRMRRYIRIVNKRSRLIMEEGSTTTDLDFGVELPSENLMIRDDIACSALTMMIRYNCGPDFNPISVSLKRERPADTGPWQKFYSCPVKFGATRNLVQIPSEILDKPLPTANPELAQLNENVVVRYLQRLDREDFPGRVRAEIVRQLPCEDFSQQLVAEAMNMSPRTMRRLLQSYDTSFMSLLKDVRQDLARRFVADDKISVTEISYMLGFSEVSSFTRAFRNWHGYPPSEARSVSS